MSKNIIKYDLIVKNRADLSVLKDKFSKFAKVDTIDQITYIEFDNKRIRVFVQDCFAPIKVGSVVKHFKGRSYYIQDRVINSEDSKPMLVYQGLYSPYEKFVRYESEFSDLVDFNRYHNTKQCYNFVTITPKRSLR